MKRPIRFLSNVQYESWLWLGGLNSEVQHHWLIFNEW